MQFIKMHGIGNDYVYINGFQHTVPDPASLAIAIANRHTGVGGDGLILALPPQNPKTAQGQMRMFNADGSESEMCGNGIRCVCKLLHDHQNITANPMKIETGAGLLTLEYTLDQNQKVENVKVDMGTPILKSEDIPTSIQGQTQLANYDTTNIIDWQNLLPDPAWLTAAGLDTRMTCVSMGNPHVTFFCKDVNAIPLAQVGPILEHHSLFPARINIHFVQIHSQDEVTMRTWERGSGITLACGTGATAVCVSGVLTNQTNQKILAHLPGGDLTLTYNPNTTQSTMTGSATEVFQGTWEHYCE